VVFFVRYRLSETAITFLNLNASTFERYQKNAFAQEKIAVSDEILT